jgi:epoxyqueuosine reductase
VSEIKQAIRDRAHEAGFDAVGFTSADAKAADGQALARFLKRGLHGDMAWMDNTDGRRAEPRKLMPEARSIIVLGANYSPATDATEILGRPDRGAISVYAQSSRDYHDVLKRRLKQLGRWIADEYDTRIKIFVDTAPVMEKPLAQRAGLGWQGKHSNLVSCEFGSWLFLGEVFLSLEIEPDRPMADHCGSCDACRRACPTDALAEPYTLEATRCISYLTIEHRGEIAADLMKNMGNHIYGCDDCLAVCPWNKFSDPTNEAAFFPRAELTAPRLADLAGLDDTAFRKVFAGSAIKRTGRNRFVRNVLIAIGNSADTSLQSAAETLLADASPIVADAARWARDRLREVQDA